ncbi:PepSY domain-containing protein [Neobacillus sp. GCM10023253]|uniref:PepSY domain-containing protein n=1 Tax=Neobacillus sp. GCM10023253 TaxID=3252644 RepID=UPI0036149DAF
MKKIAAGILLILIIGALGWYGATMAFNRSHPSLSEDKVSQMILNKYGGMIQNISMIQENYKLTLVKDQIKYDIIVNGRTGEVLSMTKQGAPDTTDRRQPETKEPPPSNNGVAPETPIAIEKAKALALEKVSGTITSAKLDEEDGELVYEIEIKQSKSKKAEVIINAYSGKIESITFETEDED